MLSTQNIAIKNSSSVSWNMNYIYYALNSKYRNRNSSNVSWNMGYYLYYALNSKYSNKKVPVCPETWIISIIFTMLSTQNIPIKNSSIMSWNMNYP